MTGFPAAGGIQYAPFARGGAGADSYTIVVANDVANVLAGEQPPETPGGAR